MVPLFLHKEKWVALIVRANVSEFFKATIIMNLLFFQNKKKGQQLIEGDNYCYY